MPAICGGAAPSNFRRSRRKLAAGELPTSSGRNDLSAALRRRRPEVDAAAVARVCRARRVELACRVVSRRAADQPGEPLLCSAVAAPAKQSGARPQTRSLANICRRVTKSPPLRVRQTQLRATCPCQRRFKAFAAAPAANSRRMQEAPPFFTASSILQASQSRAADFPVGGAARDVSATFAAKVCARARQSAARSSRQAIGAARLFAPFRLIFLEDAPILLRRPRHKGVETTSTRREGVDRRGAINHGTAPLLFSRSSLGGGGGSGEIPPAGRPAGQSALC